MELLTKAALSFCMQSTSSESLVRRARLSSKAIVAASILTLAAAVAVVTAIGETDFVAGDDGAPVQIENRNQDSASNLRASPEAAVVLPAVSR
jgi:hypothetical protein